MSANFHHLQRLSPELQLMVFEEFIRAAQSPRIVLLDVEGCQVLKYNAFLGHEVPVPGLRFRVDNREELHSESPAVVARRLLAVCSSSRQVAKRFLERPDCIDQPPEDYEALMGLGLSLHDDCFWVPDDLPRYMEVHRRPAAALEYSDQHRIRSIMLSLDTFEESLDWARKRWERDEYVSEADLRLRFTLEDLLASYFGLQSLIIMVNVPRQHVCWDQMQIVNPNDGAQFDMSDEHGSARCKSVFEKYEALRTEHMQMRSTCMPDYNSDRQPYPELCFAFPRSSPDTT